MVFEERKKWDSMATRGGVAIERNDKKHQYRKVPIVFRQRGYYTPIIGLFGN